MPRLILCVTSAGQRCVTFLYVKEAAHTWDIVRFNIKAYSQVSKTEMVHALNIVMEEFCPLKQKLYKEDTTIEAHHSLKMPDWDFGL